MSVPIPFKLNLTTVGGAAVPGFSNLAPVAYNAGVGYGYEDAIEGVAFKRGINVDEKYDTIHRLSSSTTDRIRIDVPPDVEYDVIVAIGDPAAQITNGIININDAGTGGVLLSGLDSQGANLFLHVGATIRITNYLRVQVGKIVGGPYTTAIPFIIVNPVAKYGVSMASITPGQTRTSKTPGGSKRVI